MSWMRAQQKMVARTRAEDGFTLIELLVVIVILGILSGVVVFAVRGTGDKGAGAAYATDATTLRTAQEAFCAKNGYYASDQAQLADAQLLSEPGTLNVITTNTEGACGDDTLGPSGFGIECGLQNSAPPAGCGGGGAITRGGTLVINNGGSAPAAGLNPAITSEGGTHSNSEDMFNGLLRYELDGSIGGDLAQTFDINNTVPAAANPNCASVTCDPMTTVATFVLRPGVIFHGKDATALGDGTVLAPDDVEFSFSQAILAAHGRTTAMNTPLGVTGAGLSTVVPADAIQTFPATAGNGGTVKLNFRQIFAPLRFSLNVTEAPILSRAAYEPCWTAGTLFLAGNSCLPNTEPVGTGPFRFESLNSNGITTVRNPDYFRAGLPYLDKLVKKVVSGSGADSLLSNAVDVASIAPIDRPRFDGNSNFVLSQTPRGSGGGNCITTIAFNTTKRQPGNATVASTVAPTNDVRSPHFGQNKANSEVNAEPHQILGDSRVREAIFKALDRNKFWTDVAKNAGRVADAPVHSIFQPGGAYQGAQPLPTFDPTAAGALLSAAGWSDTSNADGFRRSLNHPYKDLGNIPNNDPDLQVPDGTKLTLEYLSSANDAFSQLVKANLLSVGIDVVLQSGNNASFVAPRIFHARTFDMSQISYCNNDEPQFGVRRQYHSDRLVQTNAFTNASGYKSLMMDQLWLDASKAPDVATYQAKFLQIQRLALGLGTPGGPTPGPLEIAQRIPMVQMLESAGTRGTQAACKGFNNNNTGLYIEAVSCSR